MCVHVRVCVTQQLYVLYECSPQAILAISGQHTFSCKGVWADMSSYSHMGACIYMYLLNLSAHAHSKGYCSCPCVCVCVRSNLLPHTLESQKRDTNGFIAIQEPFKIFPNLLKMLSSEVMA